MIINLKQVEIEQALRAYVVAQGISLSGKELSISFTAGRRESGISAEISIEDIDIPGYTTDADDEALTEKAQAIAVNTTAEPATQESVVFETETETTSTDATQPKEETRPTASLFG